MKKLFVMAFMIAGSATFAQVQNVSGGNNATPNNAKMIEVQSQKMKADLGLTDDQTTQIKALFIKQDQAREAVRAEVKALRANGQQLTEAQKNDIKTKMGAQSTAADTQLKSILTPDQYTKWQGIMNARNAEFQKIAPKVG